ncbi:hypothetical protein [Streptomyces sp. NPDC056664]
MRHGTRRRSLIRPDRQDTPWALFEAGDRDGYLAAAADAASGPRGTAD